MTKSAYRRESGNRATWTNNVPAEMCASVWAPRAAPPWKFGYQNVVPDGWSATRSEMPSLSDQYWF